MDDLVLAGVLAITGLYAAAVLAVAAAGMVFMELFAAFAAGEPGRAAVILGVVFLFFAAYDGAGFWLQRTGRI